MTKKQRLKATIAELNKLHSDLEMFTGQGEPWYDDLFSRVGCIIALAKGEIEPEDMIEPEPVK
ncbi:MAG: hypothetical protein J2P48_17590 [Alphaproteobacteria bacterium]|nr:hypothetical protein [Alphaproteobacteria bacterium]